MPPETTELNQKAVLWAASGYDDYGAPTRAAAVEIDVRWESVKRDGMDAHGNKIAFDATVIVDRAIAVNSLLWLGNLADYAATETKYVVVDYTETPDLKARHYRRVVSLAKLGDTLPALAS